MTCPHCGFLMSPLDSDCARCRHRGYVPPPPPSAPIPNAQHPTPAYAQTPNPQYPTTQPSLHTLTVVACLMSMVAFASLAMFGLMLRERRMVRQEAQIAARQEAEIAALRRQYVVAPEAQFNAPAQVLTPQPQIIHVEVNSPAYPVYVPTPVYPVYDPFAEHRRLHNELLYQQQQMFRQQNEDMMRLHAANVERMNADMQRMRDRMQDARQQTQSVRDLHDPFNPFGRF